MTAPIGPVSGALPEAQAPDPKLVQAARDFEAIFLRKMLASLEKTARIGRPGPLGSGTGIYNQMATGAVATGIANGGGLGLAEVVLQALTPPAETEKVE